MLPKKDTNTVPRPCFFSCFGRAHQTYTGCKNRGNPPEPDPLPRLVLSSPLFFCPRSRLRHHIVIVRVGVSSRSRAGAPPLPLLASPPSERAPTPPRTAAPRAARNSSVDALTTPRKRPGLHVSCRLLALGLVLLGIASEQTFV